MFPQPYTEKGFGDITIEEWNRNTEVVQKDGLDFLPLLEGILHYQLPDTHETVIKQGFVAYNTNDDYIVKDCGVAKKHKHLIATTLDMHNAYAPGFAYEVVCLHDKMVLWFAPIKLNDIIQNLQADAV